MARDKVNTNHTYLEATNYWTPLNEDDGKNNETEKEEINTIKKLVTKEKQKEINGCNKSKNVKSNK